MVHVPPPDRPQTSRFFMGFLPPDEIGPLLISHVEGAHCVNSLESLRGGDMTLLIVLLFCAPYRRFMDKRLNILTSSRELVVK